MSFWGEAEKSFRHASIGLRFFSLCLKIKSIEKINERESITFSDWVKKITKNKNKKID